MAEAIACSGSSPCKILAQDHFLSASICDGSSNNRLVFLLCRFQPDTVQCCGAYGGLKRAAPPFLPPSFFFGRGQIPSPRQKDRPLFLAFTFREHFPPGRGFPAERGSRSIQGRRVHFAHLPFVWPEPLGLGEGEELIKAKHFAIKRTEEGNGRPFV